MIGCVVNLARLVWWLDTGWFVIIWWRARLIEYCLCSRTMLCPIIWSGRLENINDTQVIPYLEVPLLKQLSVEVTHKNLSYCIVSLRSWLTMYELDWECTGMDGYRWWVELSPPVAPLRGCGGNGTINSPSSKLLEAYTDTKGYS